MVGGGPAQAASLQVIRGCKADIGGSSQTVVGQLNSKTRIVSAVAVSVSLLSMFFLWTDDDHDLWHKVHYAVAGLTGKGTGWTGNSCWTGNISRWHVDNAWFMVYAALAFVTTFVGVRLSQRVCVAVLAITSICAIAQSSVLVHGAIASDATMIAPGGWVGLAGVGTCLAAAWLQTLASSRPSVRAVIRRDGPVSGDD